MKKLTFFLLTFILLSACIEAAGQKTKTRCRKLTDVTGYLLINGDKPENAFYISTKPVTNREYITYLCWLYNVYVDYPEFAYRAIPGIGSEAIISKMTDGFDLINDFTEVVLSSEINRTYIFNPAFIDWPVAGLTWNQAMSYFNWLTDRYNEIALIRKGELNFDLNQKNQNNFNNEAYLSGQYEGIVKRLVRDRETGKERRSGWGDRIYFPAFRLPSAAELDASAKLVRKDFIPYKPDSFLKSWIDHYVSDRNDTLVLSFEADFGRSIKIGPPAGGVNPYFPAKPDEFTLDYGLGRKLANVLDIYRELGQNKAKQQDIESYPWPEKNNLGFMQFVIAGEDRNSKPVLIDRISYDRQVKSADFTIFRFAMSAVR